MENSRIDAAIKAVTDEKWRKSAFVIARTVEALSLDKKWAHGLVAKRVRTLVRKGQLEIVGNPHKWRASELRRRSTGAGDSALQ
jgi:hypothetical protein